MSSLITPQGYPRFANVLDKKDLCVMCEKILRNAMTTTCGHRLCEGCVEKMFTDKQEPVSCPGQDDCEPQYKATIDPDTPARRHVVNLIVVCTKCQRQMPWKKLESHDCGSIQEATSGDAEMDTFTFGGGAIPANVSPDELSRREVRATSDLEMQLICNNEKLTKLEQKLQEVAMRKERDQLKKKIKMLKTFRAQIQTRVTSCSTYSNSSEQN